MEMVHATLVAIDGVGVLLRGRSGSGKSDLALRLLDRGARLVADDRVVITVGAGEVIGRAPAAIAGLLEVRGVGVMRVPAMAEAPIALVVELDRDAVERLPEPSRCTDLGVPLPVLRLAPFHASTPAKLRLAVTAYRGQAVGQGAEGDGRRHG